MLPTASITCWFQNEKSVDYCCLPALFRVTLVKFRFSFCLRRQATYEILGRGFHQFGLPLGNPDGLLQIAQRLLNCQVIRLLSGSRLRL